MNAEDKSEVQGLLYHAFHEFWNHIRNDNTLGDAADATVAQLRRNWKGLSSEPKLPDPEWGPGDVVRDPDGVEHHVYGIEGEDVWVDKVWGGVDTTTMHRRALERTRIAEIKAGMLVKFDGAAWWCDSVVDGIYYLRCLSTQGVQEAQAMRHLITRIAV